MNVKGKGKVKAKVKVLNVRKGQRKGKKKLKFWMLEKEKWKQTLFFLKKGKVWMIHEKYSVKSNKMTYFFYLWNQLSTK